MRYRRFAAFNVVGAAAWVTLFVVLGYKFGSLPSVKKNFQYVILAIVGISFLPVVIEWLRGRRAAQGTLEQGENAGGQG
jgi:membrane-associated protein